MGVIKEFVLNLIIGIGTICVLSSLALWAIRIVFSAVDTFKKMQKFEKMLGNISLSNMIVIDSNSDIVYSYAEERKIAGVIRKAADKISGVNEEDYE